MIASTWRLTDSIAFCFNMALVMGQCDDSIGLRDPSGRIEVLDGTISCERISCQ